MRSRLHNGASDAGANLNLDAWNDALRSLPVAAVTESDVLAWVEGPLRRFFPFDQFYGAYGKLSGGRIQMRSLISSGHGPEFLASLGSSFDLNGRGTFAWWASNRKPFIVDQSGARDEEGRPICAAEREIAVLERFSRGTVAAHGVIDPFNGTGTYISFSGVPGTEPKQTLSALRLIAPVLHTLFLQTKQAEESPVNLTVLTERQRELVDLALLGLSNRAIASHLAISENTVGNHFRAIYARLGISKRNQLIALLR